MPAERVPVSAPNRDADAAQLRYREGCRCRDAGDLDGAARHFEAALALRHDFAEAHLASGEMMAARGEYEDAVDCFQMAVHFAPHSLDAQLALAAALLRLQSPEEAEAACRRALAIDARATRAWYWLGNALKARGEFAPAVDAYRVAVRAVPPDVNALQQLAFVEFRLGRYEEAQRSFGELLAVAPQSPNAHHNFGLLQLETGYPEQALASFRRALELNPQSAESAACVAHALRDLRRLDEAIEAYDAVLARHPDLVDARANRSQAELMRGGYAEGWRQYERRFSPGGPRARSTGAAVWRGESLAGRSIAVLPEQGVGDEIMFASCLPDLMRIAGTVAVECDPRLVGLYSRSFAGATVRARDGEARGTPADFEISAGSLPLHFRRTPQEFPGTAGFLRADPQLAKAWRVKCAGAAHQYRVGIAWRGGTLRNRQYLRSLALADFETVLRQPGCRFVSLQHGDCRAELAAVAARRGIGMLDAGDAVGADMDALAAAIAALDLVITVDNTIAHLAGALGKPVWVLLPFSAEWRYGVDAERMDWYPSMRLFRQPAPREWLPPLQRVAQALAGER